MIPSPELSALLASADRIVSAFHTDPAPGAVSRALTQLHSLTSPEAARAIDVIAGRTQPDGARLLLLLALWADHRAAGGEELLSALRRSKPSSANHPPAGPRASWPRNSWPSPTGQGCWEKPRNSSA